MVFIVYDDNDDINYTNTNEATLLEERFCLLYLLTVAWKKNDINNVNNVHCTKNL